MIKQIKITNFYSFSEETITLQPDVNILIGINGSGKSNFLRAVRLLQEGIAGKGLRTHIFENLGGFDNIFYKGTKDNTERAIEIEYILDAKEVTKSVNENEEFNFRDDLIYKIKLIKSPGLQNYFVAEHIETKSIKRGFESGFEYLDFLNGVGYLHERSDDGRGSKVRYSDFDPQELVLREVSDTNRYLALTTIRRAIKDVVVYDYFDTTPRSPIRRATLATSDKRLNSDGTNLPQILNTIKINHKASYRKIVEMLEEVNENFSGFDFNFIGGGNIELMLEEKGLGSSVHVSNISDGTLRYLCLLAILYNPDRGNFICIDEPEVGLHPDMILNIANAIKEASEQSALIISTHSDNLLNYFSIENLYVFEKDENNATAVTTYAESDFKGWYKTFTLGKMWVAGDFGGVRYGG